MPLFLKDFDHIHIGTKDTSEIELITGISPTYEIGIIIGIFRENGVVTNVFGKACDKPASEEVKTILSSVRTNYQHWYEHDYSQFDSVLQREEAAQVRGLLLDASDEKEALEVIKRLIAKLEEDKLFERSAYE